MDYKQARDQYQSAAQNATNMAAATTLLPDRLKAAINEKINYNKDIIDARSTAQAKYFSAPDEARLKYADTVNPLYKEALVNKYKANAYQPYAAYTGVLENRMGTISDITDSASRAAQSKTISAQGAADIAKDLYNALFSEYQTNAQLALERQRLAASNKPKELSIGDIVTLKEMGVETPENLTYDEAKNLLSTQGTIPQGPKTKSDYTTFAPKLAEQLLLDSAGGDKTSFQSVVNNLNSMGYDPLGSDGGPLYDVLLRFYPEIAEDYVAPTYKKGIDTEKAAKYLQYVQPFGVGAGRLASDLIQGK